MAFLQAGATSTEVFFSEYIGRKIQKPHQPVTSSCFIKQDFYNICCYTF